MKMHLNILSFKYYKHDKILHTTILSKPKWLNTLRSGQIMYNFNKNTFIVFYHKNHLQPDFI